MKWCPVTIRSDLESTYTTSGIYIYNGSTELCITISSTLAASLAHNKAICTLDASLDRVVWENLELTSAPLLDEVNADLANYKREFKVVPGDQFQLLVFKFTDPGNASLRNQCAQSPLTAAPAVPLSSVVTTSSPFGAAHTSLFHGYVTTGTVSLVQPNMVFVDGRFLDGMEGGLVRVPQLGAIGLVGGSMVKQNGEGRLLLVVPWQNILQRVPGLAAVPRLTFDLPDKKHSSGIAAVQIRIKPRFVSWGSGVLVAPNLVVTNNHVVNNNPPEKIETRIDDTTRFVKTVHRPIKSLDLVVLELDGAFPLSTTSATLAQSGPQVGDRCYAIGYGLFAPERHGLPPQPLHSEGIISKNVKGMVMATASCWNGSSGGGLYNNDDELIGIMASNARDNGADEIMPDVAMSIPVSILRQVLNKLTSTVSNDAETDSQFQKIWKLDRTHRDVSQRAKL